MSEKLQTDMKSNLNISKQNIQVYDVIMPHRLQCGAQSIHSTTRNLQHAPQPCVCAHTSVCAHASVCLCASVCMCVWVRVCACHVQSVLSPPPDSRKNMEGRGSEEVNMETSTHKGVCVQVEEQEVNGGLEAGGWGGGAMRTVLRGYWPRRSSCGWHVLCLLHIPASTPTSS